MADQTAAERQRRRRAHKRGDHSLCDPGREDCSAVTVTPAVTRDRDAVPAAGVSLGSRGRRLWRQLTEGGTPLQPAEQVLAEEACRTADRLDVLDRILRGDQDSWLRLAPSALDGTVVRVVVNGALTEVRQQQIALKQLLTELRQSRGGGVAAPPARPKSPVGTQGGGGVPAGVTSLAARIAAKRSGASAG